MVDNASIDHTHRAGPEDVVLGSNGATEELRSLARWEPVGIAWLADDSDEAVLSNRARSPAVRDLRFDPLTCPRMVDVIAVKQGQKDVNV